MSQPAHYRPPWNLVYELSASKVWHAFILHALLCDWDKLGKELEVPNDCDQDDRLAVAMAERNCRLREFGDVTARLHVCDLCCRDIDYGPEHGKRES